jgi:putative ABC transport system permease protein
MRGRDLIGLALAAFWQSRTRTLLTLAGVALGAGMLVVSLSLGHGLRKLVEDEFGRDDRLRRIMVYSVWQAPPVEESAIPPEEIEVRGTMSEERRKRLRQYLIRRYRDQQPRRPALLTPDKLDALAKLEYVAAVVPDVYESVEVSADGHAPQPSGLMLLSGGPHSLERRLVFGRLPDPGRAEALVSETLLFNWGVVDDAAVQGVLGRPLRVEVREDRSAAPYRLLELFGATALALSPAELRELGELAERLPVALERLDLPPAQAKLVKSLVERFGSKRPDGGQPRHSAATFTIVGVHHTDTGDDYDVWFGTAGDVAVSVGPARAMLERLPRYTAGGYNRAIVTADRADHVRGLLKELEGLGYHTTSLVEWAERVYQEVTLIGLGMTVLSVLALVVAGLGITNTMVTSVLERTHDIGIMKAVGARDRQVLGMFLIEGAVLGLIGGGLGLAGAWLLSLPAEGWIHRVIEHQAQRKVVHPIFAYPAWLLAGAPLFAMLVTTAAALLPARRAARIDPAVTLRTE